MRTKTIAIKDSEGPGVKIGALTLEQVESYLAADLAVDKLGIPKSSYDLICDGLNNGQKSEDEPWTEKRVRKEFDLLAIKQLQDEIMQYSGLKAVESQAGEIKAAAT